MVRGGATQEGKQRKKELPRLAIPYATSSWSALMAFFVSQTFAMEMVKTNTMMATTMESPMIPVFRSGSVGGGTPGGILPTTGMLKLEFNSPK